MNWLNKSIANKLMATIILGSLVVVLATLFSYTQTTSSFDEYNSLLEEDIDDERHITEILTLFKTQVQEWKNTLLRGYDAEKRTKYWDRFQKIESEIQDKGQGFVEHIKNPESKANITKFLTAHKKMGVAYRDGYEAFVDANFDSKVGDKAVSGIDREPAKLLAEAAEAIAQASAEKSAAVSESALSHATLALVILLVAVTLYIVISLIIINKAIILPSRSLISSINLLSKGQLHQDVDIHRDDELGRLADASRDLKTFLSDISQQLTQSNIALTKASETLSHTTEGVQERIGRAHNSTDHVASAMAEMSATSQEVASHAAAAASAASDADSAASESSSAMHNAQTSVNQLSNQVGQSVETVKKLAEDTNEVGKVLSVIRGIAEQTNLLALNAAIEAARAGDQGRGFAVVADEVRTLAQKTQQSTEEIEGIINNVQLGAQNTVEVMDASFETTNRSAELFASAAEKLQTVTNSVEQITELSHQVATAAEEQTNVSEDITRTIVEVSDLVEETVKSASASKEVADELREMARAASQLAGRFNSN
jgi:methyl-accepting chemotaxis protein